MKVPQAELDETDATVDRLASALLNPETVLSRTYGETDDDWAARATLAVLTGAAR